LKYSEGQGQISEVVPGFKLPDDLVLTSFPVDSHRIQVRITNLADYFDGDHLPHWVDLKSIFPRASKFEEINLSGNMPIGNKPSEKWLSQDH